MRLRLWALWGVTAFIGTLSAAQFRYSFYRHTSLSITGMAESRDGILWIASRQGLFRFDGFHFENVTPPAATVHDVDITEDATVWVSSKEGLLRYREGRFETVVPGDTHQAAVIGNALMFRNRRGVWKRNGDGRIERPNGCEADYYYAQILVSASRTFQVVCGPAEEPRVREIGPEAGALAALVRTPGDWIRVVTDSRRDTWLEHKGLMKLYRLRPGSQTPEPHPMPRYDQLYQYRLISDTGDSTWFLGNPTVNLTKGFSLDRGRGYPRINMLATGRRNNVWVAELRTALVNYRLTDKWERWTSEEIAASDFGLLARSGSRPLVYGSTGPMIWKDDSPAVNGKSGGRVRHLAEMPGGDILAILPESGLFILGSSWRVKNRVLEPQIKAPYPSSQYAMAKADGKGRIWVSGSTLFRLERQGEHWRPIPVDLPRRNEDWAVTDIQIDRQGRPWVGYAEGIAYLDADEWKVLETDGQCRDIASFELDGDNIWVAHSAPGRYTRLHREGARWHMESFADAESTVTRTRWVRVDSRGWIWRAVDDGVRVSNGKDLQNWLYLRQENGLDIGAPMPHGFYEEADGSIWIAGAGGLAHFLPRADWFEAPRNAPPPAISRVSASNGQVKATVGGLEMPAFREYPIEYRLLPLSAQWRGTRDGNVEVWDVPDNDYALEVRYAGLGVSPVARQAIRVGAQGQRFSWGALLVGLGAIPLAWVLARKVDLYGRLLDGLTRYAFGSRGGTSEGGSRLSQSPASGAVVGERFELGKLVADGGFSRVYKGQDRKTGESVAVKIIDPVQNDRALMRRRFAFEQNALRMIKHPNVVELIDGGISRDGSLYIVTPFLTGDTLRRRLSESPIPPAEALPILRQLASALDAAHSKGIMHLDFKPENVILTSDGPMLIDFGASGLAGPEGEQVVTMTLVGSAGYLAPESLIGQYSVASDVFSFGVVAQEILTGKMITKYSAGYYEPEFLAEFAETLQAVAGENRRSLAEQLKMAFEPVPAKRPVNLSEWVEGWIGLLRVGAVEDGGTGSSVGSVDVEA